VLPEGRTALAKAGHTGVTRGSKKNGPSVTKVSRKG
jgi:hypothetical protein